jgi:uncharacterized integral membrane protein
MPTPLDDYPNVRLAVYRAFWVIGLLIGSIQVACATLPQGTPSWMHAVTAVYAFLGAAVGYTASANTVKGENP